MSISALDNPIYRELGVKPVIHCGGTKSLVGGSRMAPAVLDAMAAASRTFVSIPELNERVGAYIAEVTGAEAGMVTAGAASGVVLSAAACMTGTDVAKIRALPDATGMPDRVIVQRIHRGRYSHMYAFPGATIVEVGDINDGALPRELEAAIAPGTAAVTHLVGPGIPRVGLALPEVVAIAHRAGVPVIVDAAAMLPPRANLRRFIDEGADLVTISGGKLIHGPQASGLLFGRRDLVAAALASSSPHHAIGRPQKIGREQIVGLYAALKLYMTVDEDALMAEYRARLEPIVRAVSAIDGISVEVVHDDWKHHVPTAVVSFSPGWRGPRGRELADRLWRGEPRIYVPWDGNVGSLHVNPISLQDGEAAIVAAVLHRHLS